MRLLVLRRADEVEVKGRSTIVIKIEDRLIERGLRDIDAILIIGSNVKISSSVPPVLASRNVPLAIMAKDNIAITVNPIGTSYNNYRRLQYGLEKEKALNIALEYIKAKIGGMRNILKYYGKKAPEIPQAPSEIGDPREFETRIRIWESRVSQMLWEELFDLVNPKLMLHLIMKYNFVGRKPRHRDPFNKTLSVMYAVLYSLATKALIAAGLDPTYGFLHRTRYSTPLTFDYTEMFKPIAIEATITLLNKYGLPELDDEGELTREWTNKAINRLYEYLSLKHKDTGKSPYRQVFLKAFCLAKYLEGRCRREMLTITWNRRQYRVRRGRTA